MERGQRESEKKRQGGRKEDGRGRERKEETLVGLINSDFQMPKVVSSCVVREAEV